MNEVATKVRSKQLELWSLSDLKRLNLDQLVDRFEQINNQYVLYKWRILWEIRQRFASDKLFGQYLNKLRDDPEYPVDFGVQQTVSRSIRAGGFCEKYKINDLNKAGLLAESVLLMASPIYSEVANDILHKVRRQNLKAVTVKQLLVDALIDKKQMESITADTPIALEHIQDLTGVIRHVPVIDGLAIEPTDEQEDDVIESVIVDKAEREEAVARTVASVIESTGTHSQLYRILRELSLIDGAKIPDDEILDIWDAFDDVFKRTDFQLVVLLKTRIGVLQDRLYKK